MISVGIDISKGKSVMTALSINKEAIVPPFEFLHTKDGLQHIVSIIKELGSATKVVMEATGHYHEPVANTLCSADIFTSVVNPLLVHSYGGNSVRKIKTDKKDSQKIAAYGLDNWEQLRKYIPPETVRQQLKLFSRQYNLCIKTVHALENNLRSVLDQTFPGMLKFFSSQKKKNGHQKWVDFAIAFWHCNIITDMSQAKFLEIFEAWCKNNTYKYTLQKALEIYEKSHGHHTSLEKCEHTGQLVQTAGTQVLAVSTALAQTKQQLVRLAEMLPEYPVVISLYGVGELTAAQLIAEIGDVRRFYSGRALVAFAGIDPLPHQSGTYDKKSAKVSKRGSAPLRKALFHVAVTHIRLSPPNEPLYSFLDKKREEGKPFYVYMTAAANKFLRIYYARVKEFLENP